jgi:hypothetical protein
MTFEASLIPSESLSGNGHASLIDLVHQVNHGPDSLPSHCGGPLEHALHRAQQCSVLVHIENTPKSLDEVALAVIGRIVSQNDSKLSRSGKLKHSSHKLCPSARNIRPFVQVYNRLLDLRIGFLVPLSPVLQTINDEIAGLSCKVPKMMVSSSPLAPSLKRSSWLWCQWRFSSDYEI